MLDAPQKWRQDFADLPATEDDAWADNLADLIESLTTGKLTVTGISPAPQFTFNKTVFAQALKPIQAGPSPVPQTAMSLAWQQAVLASQMVISAGASVGAPSPATIFSAPPLTVLDPVSVAATAQILQTALVAASPASDAQLSAVPVAFRTAFISVLVTATGINSVSPTPAPLVLPPTPLQ